MGGKGKGKGGVGAGVEQRVEYNAQWAVSSPATRREEVWKCVRGCAVQKGSPNEKDQVVRSMMDRRRSLATPRGHLESVHMQLSW